METGITQLSLIPVRSTTSEHSEQVTQLLFGEQFEVLKKCGSWLYIRSFIDDYEGWINKNMAGNLSDSTHANNSTHANKRKEMIVPAVIAHATDDKGRPMYIPGGVRIPVPDENNRFTLGDRTYTLDPLPDVHITLEEIAGQFLNAPYLWGGKTVFGIDCSAFVQIVFRMLGNILPRDASQQAIEGETICFRHDALPGDVAFFEDNNGKIIHTGIILNEKHIIHASGSVRIDLLDHSGIYNTDTGRYSHNLSVIKRFFTDIKTS
ncbi:MAG: C40 family peptidase [Bacteroidota bacterium]|nr:C40 family peptidase [Bacteroidota bacterium]